MAAQRTCGRCGAQFHKDGVRDVWLGLWSRGRRSSTPDLGYGANTYCAGCCSALADALESLGFTVIRAALRPGPDDKGRAP
jgi:hypothetical protein